MADPKFVTGRPVVVVDSEGGPDGVRYGAKTLSDPDNDFRRIGTPISPLLTNFAYAILVYDIPSDYYEHFDSSSFTALGVVTVRPAYDETFNYSADIALNGTSIGTISLVGSSSVLPFGFLAVSRNAITKENIGSDALSVDVSRVVIGDNIIADADTFLESLISSAGVAVWSGVPDVPDRDGGLGGVLPGGPVPAPAAHSLFPKINVYAMEFDSDIGEWVVDFQSGFSSGSETPPATHVYFP